MLQEAVDVGINFFDTADVYSQGQSEVIVGRALRRRRSEVVIATKGGYLVPSRRRLAARIKPLVRPVIRRLPINHASTGGPSGGPMAQDFSPQHLRRAVEASLRRLRTDYVDVYQLHSPPRSLVDSLDYVAVLDELRAEGKILHYGLAADEPDDVTDYDRQPGIASLQVPFNLVHRDAARVLFPKAAAHGTAIIARSCYAAGLFEDNVTEATLRALTPDWREFVRLRDTSRMLGRPLLETALQFCLASAPITVTILGTRTPAHLRQNLRFHAAAPLREDEMGALFDAPARGGE